MNNGQLDLFGKLPAFNDPFTYWNPQSIRAVVSFFDISVVGVLTNVVLIFVLVVTS